MSFLCNFFKRNDYHVEVYTIPAKNTSNLNDPFADTESSRNSNENFFPQLREQPLRLAYSVPVHRGDSLTTVGEPRIPRLKGSNLNPEQPSYLLLDTKKIEKEELVNLLRDKEKWISGGAGIAQNTVMRMVRKSDYQQKANYNYNGKKWQDQSFPPVPTYQTPTTTKIPLVWPSLQELSKLFDKHFCFMDADFNPTDIIQGHVGDCYFLSAVAALIRKTERVPRLFPNCKINANGVYMAQLMFKGILQEVVIDDRFPMIKDSNKLLGCTSQRQSFEIYGMVLQKCWAKLWKSYQKIDGGFPHEALHALTCAPTKNYMLTAETETPEKKQLFWKQVLGFSQSSFVMCAGTDSNNNHTLKIGADKVVKVAADHIYCVEYFFEDFTTKQKMVRLYNPWGNNGDKIAGQIEVAWDQFIANFSYLSVCKVNDNANYLFTQLQDCKTKQFTFIELIVYEPKNGYFAFSLSETDRKKAPKEKPYLMVTFFALKCIQGPPNPKYQLMTLRTNYEYADHYFELYGLTPGKYMIGMYFSEVNINETLTFGVYSKAVFGFREADFDQKSQQVMLEQGFMSYQLAQPAESERVYPLGKDKDVWYSFNVMCSNSNFGYLMLHVGKNQKKYSIGMGRQAILQKNMSMWKSYDAKTIVLAGEPGTDGIVFMTIDKFQEYRDIDRTYVAKAKKHYHRTINIDRL